MTIKVIDNNDESIDLTKENNVIDENNNNNN